MFFRQAMFSRRPFWHYPCSASLDSRQETGKILMELRVRRDCLLSLLQDESHRYCRGNQAGIRLYSVELCERVEAVDRLGILPITDFVSVSTGRTIPSGF
jgi:hypothetical protein